MRSIGFVVNPIAGLGGRLGLKGTDGAADQALAAGAEPVAVPRARAFADAFLRASEGDSRLDVSWVVGGGDMGERPLREAGIRSERIAVVHVPPARTRSVDTSQTVEVCLSRGAELIVFCGGDGTARDVAAAVVDRVPILGIPAGVKMHSGVFAVHPAAAADLVAAFLRGQLREGSGELLDLDEEAYRQGRWEVRLFSTAKTLVEPHLVSAGKMMVSEVSDTSIRAEFAVHFSELFEEHPDTMFLLGPGSTIDGIASSLGIEKTLLGIDAVLGGTTIAKDLNEARLLELLERHPKAKLVVSPVGAQGFILGRGNLQVSPAVLRRIGLANLIVVATPSKLAATPVLRVDTGDADLDRDLREKEYLFVVVGYRTSKVHPIQGSRDESASMLQS
jgi:predicted polyphosphate/ATP-dependent NAD kinase